MNNRFIALAPVAYELPMRKFRFLMRPKLSFLVGTSILWLKLDISTQSSLFSYLRLKPIIRRKLHFFRLKSRLFWVDFQCFHCSRCWHTRRITAKSGYANYKILFISNYGLRKRPRSFENCAYFACAEQVFQLIETQMPNGFGGDTKRKHIWQIFDFINFCLKKSNAQL